MAIKAVFESGKTSVTVGGLYQWDYGQMLEIEATDLPSIVEVHFACSNMDEALVRVCSVVNNVASVAIPDVCLEQASTITAWVYEIEGMHGHTSKTITLPIVARKRPSTSVAPTEEQTDKYTELISEVNRTVADLGSGNVVVANAAHSSKTDYATSAGNAASANQANYASSAGNASTANHATQADLATKAKRLEPNCVFYSEEGVNSVREDQLDTVLSGVFLVQYKSGDDTDAVCTSLLYATDERDNRYCGTLSASSGGTAGVFSWVEAVLTQTGDDIMYVISAHTSNGELGLIQAIDKLAEVSV